jgi:hypothetical protein
MDVFDLHARLVEDYAWYTRSFIKIADPRIKTKVDGALWPEPLLQLNPTFLPGGTVDDLVAEGTLHPECKKIFRIGRLSTCQQRPHSLRSWRLFQGLSGISMRPSDPNDSGTVRGAPEQSTASSPWNPRLERFTTSANAVSWHGTRFGVAQLPPGRN